MAETYPLDFPTAVSIQSVEWIAKVNVGVTASPFNYKQQVQRGNGEKWEGIVALPPMTRETAEAFNAFRLRLRGRFGTFLLGDPNGSTPLGSASTNAGTPVVNGASQTGHELDIDGLPASATNYLKAGDYIQLGSGSTARLHKILENVSSNASGEATLNIFPDLRESPDDNATVVVSAAKGVFRIATNETSWSISKESIYSLSFPISEAL